jgi:hypothetical protein
MQLNLKSIKIIVDTGGKFATGINNTGGTFATGVNDTGGKQWEQFIRLLTTDKEFELFFYGIL